MPFRTVLSHSVLVDELGSAGGMGGGGGAREAVSRFLSKPSVVFQRPDALRAVLLLLPLKDLQMVLAYVVGAGVGWRSGGVFCGFVVVFGGGGAVAAAAVVALLWCDLRWKATRRGRSTRRCSRRAYTGA